MSNTYKQVKIVKTSVNIQKILLSIMNDNLGNSGMFGVS